MRLLAWPSPPNKVFFLPPHRPRQGEADWGEKKSQDSCSISFKAIRESTKATHFIRQEAWHFVRSQTLGGCQTSEVWVQNQWCGWSALWASRRRGDTASKKQKGLEATFEGPCQPLGERYRRFEHFEAGSGPQGAPEIPKGLLTIISVPICQNTFSPRLVKIELRVFLESLGPPPSSAQTLVAIAGLWRSKK